jgi:predicted RNase H-like HicB family nuclease
MGVQPRESDDEETVTITESDGYVVARDETTGVASQGDTKTEALENLAEALERHTRPEPDDVDPSEPDAPWFSDEQSAYASSDPRIDQYRSEI